MKVYEATITDKVASPTGEEPVRYESYVAIYDNDKLPEPYTDEDIQYYFTEDEFKPVNGTIETDEFIYWVGERVA